MNFPSRQVSTLIIAILGWITLSTATAADKAPTPRPPWTKSRIKGAPEPPAPYRIVPAFPLIRFQKPTCIEEIPGANRLLVTEIGGKIFTFVNDSKASKPDLLVDLRELLPKELADKNLSLFDAELHPKFRENRYLFVCYVHPGQGGHSRVSRFTLTGDSPPKVVPGSEHVVITWPTGGHNAGCLEFGKDGFLYIATGDGSGPNPPDGLTSGQTVTDLLGAILRIDVDRSSPDRPYSIPSDNPFLKLAGARPEIWAYGLRNPWKFGVDPESGNIFAADNGWESWEMVHKIVRGGNCGWPVMEGRAALRSEVPVGPTPIIPPVKDHPHTEANSVIGGPVYRGSKLPGLVGSFVYGDYITGTIWSITPDREEAYSNATLVDTDQRIIAFTQTAAGELFVLDYDFTGQIYELLPSQQKNRTAEFPRRLSETGLFDSLEKLHPAPGVIPYSVRVNRWMDGALAERWVAIPGDGKIQLATDQEHPAVYPEGTVFVNNLTLPQGNNQPAIRLETQLLHFENGVWHPYSYLWDETGKDARLVEATGTRRPLQVTDATTKNGTLERTWQVNATNECKLCHEAGAGFVLGFSLNQLNRPSRDGSESQTENQLSQLAAQGVLVAAPTVAASDPRRLVDPHDANQKLDDRARSYLHANCSMCHHPGGNAIVSFYLRRELPFEKLNTNKGTGIGTFGMHDAKIIVPGDPYRSVLMYRMSKLGYARMPYIGSQLVDSAGVALIEEWIRSMPKDGSSSEKGSAPATPGTAEFQNVRALAVRSAPQPDRREEAIRRLISSTEGSLALISQLHRKATSKEDSQLAISIGTKAPTSDIRGLFETFIPESERRKTLGAKIDPQSILGLKGDLERGKLIFYSDGARCRNCHEIDDRSKSLGPTLQEINKKYPQPVEMLQHVLQPSLKIEESVAAYAVTLNDGRILSGLVVENTDAGVMLKTAEKQIVRIVRQGIEEMRKSDKSLMPEQILSDLTAQEAADLFEYIRSQGVPK